MKSYTLNPNHIHLFQVSESLSLFFHGETLQIYPLEHDNDIYLFLKMLQENGIEKTKQTYLPKDYAALSKFVSKQIGNAPRSFNIGAEKAKEDYYRTVILPISDICNLNCPYCFAQTDGGFRFGSYTKADIDKIADFLVTKNGNADIPLTFIFFGGEPLLKLDIIKYTIQLFKEKYPQIKVSYSITTNGTILNEEIITLFKENNFAVLVSIDGPDNEFNLRHFKHGGKSVQKVIENIAILKQNNIPHEIRATILNTNPCICETFDFFEKLESSFNIVFAYQSENKSHQYADYNAEILHSIDIQLQKLLDYYIDKVKKRSPIYYKGALAQASMFRYRIKKNISCGAGNGFYTITADGTIYSCAHFMNDAKYAMGTIEQGILNPTDYVPVNIQEIKECEPCWVKYLCQGGCIAQKISVGKANNTAKTTGECELSQLLWEFQLKLYYHILQIAPEYIKKEEQKNIQDC